MEVMKDHMLREKELYIQKLLKQIKEGKRDNSIDKSTRKDL